MKHASQPGGVGVPAFSLAQCRQEEFPPYKRTEKKSSSAYLRTCVFGNLLLQNCPEGKICGKFLKKKQKCTLSKVGFDRKKNCLYVLLAYNAPSICPRQNASATAYSAPNRTSTAVCTAAQSSTSYECTEE